MASRWNRWMLSTGISGCFRLESVDGLPRNTQLGWEPVKQLHDDVVGPIATKKTRGARYRNWKLVSLDGSTMDVADTKENQQAFGRPGASRGTSAYPQIRFVSLVENGTQRAVWNPDGGLCHW